MKTETFLALKQLTRIGLVASLLAVGAITLGSTASASSYGYGSKSNHKSSYNENSWHDDCEDDTYWWGNKQGSHKHDYNQFNRDDCRCDQHKDKHDEYQQSSYGYSHKHNSRYGW